MKPCRCMPGPPMPWIYASGTRGRRPDSMRSASMSPDTSPATIAIFNLSDNATCGTVEEIAQRPDLLSAVGRRRFLFSKRGLGFFQRQVGFVDQLVGFPDC